MIHFESDGIRFIYRVAGVVIQKGEILMQMDPAASYWYLPGGRVNAGESSREALRRELREEFGVDARVGRALWVVENFFQAHEERFHEIGIYFETAMGPGIRMKTTEGAVELLSQWHPLDRLGSIDFRPSCLASRFHALPDSIEHIIHQGRQGL